jgi:predicted nucleic acid-binding protein
MPDKAFFDTNILVYAFSDRDPRQDVALDLLLGGGSVGVQTLNKFVNVITRKLKMPWRDAMVGLDTVQKLCEPAIAMMPSVHRRGLDIAQASGYHLYDSLMLAAAIEASCTIFYSEDIHDEQAIDSLTIRNPFS